MWELSLLVMSKATTSTPMSRWSRAGLTLAVVVGLLAQAFHYHDHDDAGHDHGGLRACTGDHAAGPGSAASEHEECLGCHLSRLPRDTRAGEQPRVPAITVAGSVVETHRAELPEDGAPTTLRSRGPPFSA